MDLVDVPMADPRAKFGVCGLYRTMPKGPESLDRNPPTLDFFERLGCGCVVIDASGRVLRANEYVSRCLGRGITIRNERLTATDTACDNDLQKLIGAVLAAASRSEVLQDAVAICDEQGHQFIVRAEPVNGPVPAAYSGAKGLIRIIDLDDTTEVPLLDVLQSVFRLTPAEAKVAQRIGCGDTPDEIAEQHNISPGTVREQLKAIFQKTHTRRQAQLVCLLARLGRLSR